MRGLFYFSLGALVVLVVAVPALAGKEKGAAKGKDKPKPAAAHAERGASGKSARATGSRGTDRAAESQELGQGKEHRGFEEPAGLGKKSTPASGEAETGAKGKAKGKAKAKSAGKGKGKATGKHK